MHDFELAYSRSQPVADWLVKKMIAPASSMKIPERGDKLISLSVGTGMMFDVGDSAASVVPSLRLGRSARRVV